MPSLVLIVAMAGLLCGCPHSRARGYAWTSDVQLHIGESRDSGFNASRCPGTTKLARSIARKSSIRRHRAKSPDCADDHDHEEYKHDALEDGERRLARRHAGRQRMQRRHLQEGLDDQDEDV